MAADLELLTLDFRGLVKNLIDNCKEMQIEMRPNEGLRTPIEQGKLWRQSRSREEINAKISELQRKNANFLAQCIERAGIQNGPHVTNAIPGYSWHQWGEALDCFWVVKGKAVWDLKTTVNGKNGYIIYAEEARKLQLDAGYFWTSFKDAPHVQMRPQANPTKIYSLIDINRIMEERFSQ